MTREEVLTLAEEWDMSVMFMDGYDDCIEGVIERFGQEPIVCYSKSKVIEKLMRDGMSHE